MSVRRRYEKTLLVLVFSKTPEGVFDLGLSVRGHSIGHRTVIKFTAVTQIVRADLQYRSCFKNYGTVSKMKG